MARGGRRSGAGRKVGQKVRLVLSLDRGDLDEVLRRLGEFPERVKAAFQAALEPKNKKPPA